MDWLRYSGVIVFNNMEGIVVRICLELKVCKESEWSKRLFFGFVFVCNKFLILFNKMSKWKFKKN